MALHGRDTSVAFFGTKIDAYTLSQIIRQRKDYKLGTPIRLLSCDTGNTDNTGDYVAQIVANKLGVIVDYQLRTRGEKLVRLDQYGPYRWDELTRTDHFLHAYMGKEYGGSACEVCSMGFEYLFTKPEKIQQDRHMYQWLLGLLLLK